MGNNNSQGAGRRVSDPQQQWAHSFPRDLQRMPHLKVLPEGGLNQRLRTTDNGAILNLEGTIRGRRSSFRELDSEGYHGNRVSRSRSVHEPQPEPFHRTRTQMYRDRQGNSFNIQAKKFGSEPDLRIPNKIEPPRTRQSRGRKKYKAPAPPLGSTGEGSSPESYHWELASGGETSDSQAPQRKLRLFKTRAETHRHAHQRPPELIKKASIEPKVSAKPVMQRSLSSPEFQAELRAVTEKLRVIDRKKFMDHSQEESRKKAAKMVTMDHHNILAKQRLIQSVKENIQSEPEKPVRIEPKRIETKHIEKPKDNSSRNLKTEEVKTTPPAKTFYFGMDENEELSKSVTQHNLENLKPFVDKVDKPSNLENLTPYKIQHSSSESALSSEMDLEEPAANPNDISMKLRPTLPKKQLDIPRFSPASAWRLLSSLDLNSTSLHENEEGPVLMEERIERLSRPVVMMPVLGHRSSHDKSGDSGISGDAVPTLLEDITDPIPKSRPPLVAWTPQQDLEEEASSSDGGLEIPKTDQPTDVKFHARNHVFSLSLPRETHLAQYTDKSRNGQSFNSLQKLRKSLGAALGTKLKPEESSTDDNWFLSTSAPHSLNLNSYKVDDPESEEDEKDPEPTMLKSPSFTYLANGGHVMYLPTVESKDDVELRKKYTPNKLRNSMVKSIEIPCRKEFGQALKRLPLSKSCENISGEMKQINRTPSPVRKSNPRISNIEDRKNSKLKPKRFTFQSTVRQIERRRIAEKLSKEAERKEKQRLGELEAMRRVEEEFQRKRAREKASIRQQLRLYSLDENHQNWDHDQLRSEPDGAVSSSPSSSPTNQHPRYKDSTPYISKIVETKMSRREEKTEQNEKNQRLLTDLSRRINSKSNYRSSPISRSSDDGRIKTEVLSEFRTPIRDYREYRSYPRYVENPVENQTTVHPKVVYNMPKAKQGNTYHEVCTAEGSASPHSDNYRRNFAHGAIPTSSDSELSQPNTRTHSPRHVTRNRASSASPDQSDDEKPNTQVIEEPIVVSNQFRFGTALTEDPVLPNGQNIDLPIINLTNPQPFNPTKSFKPVTFNIK